MAAENATPAFYENSIPPFVEPELERLYGSLYSSMAQFRVYGGSENASTYVAARDGCIVDILLYQPQGRTLRVLNEGMRLEHDAVNLFARAAFARYPEIDMITFRAILPAFERLPYPCQRFHATEDIVLELPDAIDDWRSSLSKSTRQHLNYYLNRLKRAFPDFRLEVYEKEQISEEMVHAIVSFNRMRMAAKNKASTIDDAELGRIYRLARERGMVTVIRLNGRICAGSVRYRIGSTYFARVNAHDPAYDDYRIGTLCCYLTICECIARGGKRFSFDHGQFENKYRFLGKDVNLENLTVYRSYGHLLLNGGIALRIAASGYAGEIKVRLVNLATGNKGALSRWANMLISLLRAVKRKVSA